MTMKTNILRKIEGPTSTVGVSEYWASDINTSPSVSPEKKSCSSAGASIATVTALGLATAVANWSALSPTIVVPTAPEIKRAVPSGISHDATERKKLLDKIRKYSSYEANWDGYGGAAASSQAIRDVTAFVRQLPFDTKQPKPQLSGDGGISLIWELPDLFIDAGFYGDGKLAFFVNSKNNGELFGQEIPVAKGIPHAIISTLSHVNV